MNPFLGMAIVLALLGALFAGIRLLGARAHPEIARKALHVGMGMVCLAFPWIFHELWPVVTLGAVAAAALLALRTLPTLRSSVGPVLHGVERASLGEFYFIAGAVALFCMSFGHPAFFVIPLLWLTFADATAALIGVKYGTVRYDTYDGRKSIEGSVSFAIVTFIATFVPLVAAGYANALQDGLISIIVGVLAMMLEAVAWNGIDNMIIPIFGYAFLKTLVGAPVWMLAVDAAALGGMAALTHFRRDRTTLSEDALLASILSGYAFWVLGGWHWLVAPVTLFLKDKLQSKERGELHRHNVHAVVAIVAIGLIAAVINVKFPNSIWYLAFTSTFAMQIAIFDITMRTHVSSSVRTIDALVSGLTAWMLMFLPYIVIAWKDLHTLPMTVSVSASLPIVILAAVVFSRIQPGIIDCPRDAMRWLRQDSVAAAGTVLVVALAAFA